MAKRYWLDSGSWPLKEHVELPLKAILFGVPFTEKNRETLSFVPFLPDFLPVTPACIAVGLQPRKVLYLVLAVASRPKNNFICPWRVRGALAEHVANISTSHRNGQGYIGDKAIDDAAFILERIGKRWPTSTSLSSPGVGTRENGN